MIYQACPQRYESDMLAATAMQLHNLLKVYHLCSITCQTPRDFAKTEKKQSLKKMKYFFAWQ